MMMMLMMMLMMHLQNRKQIGEVISIGNSIVSVGLFYPRWECVWPEISSDDDEAVCIDDVIKNMPNKYEMDMSMS